VNTPLAISAVFFLGCFAPLLAEPSSPAERVPARAAPSPGTAKSDLAELHPFVLEEAETNPNHPDFFRTHLKRYGLAPLAETPAGDHVERCRFLWRRCFHPAVLFEVEFQADGTGEYRAMVWKDDQGKARWVPEKTRRLDQGALASHRLMLSRWDMFTLPRYDGRSGYDGSGWFIELVRGDQHHSIYRWSPENGPVRMFGAGLIEGAIDSVLVPIY
jgi:hypothetical protein